MLEKFKLRPLMVISIFLTLLIVSLIDSGISYLATQQIRAADSLTLVKETQVARVNEIQELVTKEYSRIGDMLFLGDTKYATSQQYVDAFDQVAAEAHTLEGQFQANITGDKEKNFFDMYVGVESQMQTLFKDEVVPVAGSASADARQYLYNQASILVDQAETIADELGPLEKDEALAATQSADAMAVQMLIMVIVASVVALIIGVSFTNYVLDYILSNIDKILGAAQTLTSGNLTQRLVTSSQNEFGVLGTAFNQMADRLSEMIHSEQAQRQHIEEIIEQYVGFTSQVMQGNLTVRIATNDGEQTQNDPLLEVLGKSLNEMTASLQNMIAQTVEAASNLGLASTEILAATTQQASGATEQSAAITQTTSTVNEVKTISEQSSLRLKEVASASQRTVEVARSGQKAVQEMIESMGQIKERVEAIAENTLALSEQTQQIGEIITTVNEIAAQSNMLALNASVEAARAGEHGKGFAVVAMEVRNLAEQSKQATAQVRTILSEIQKATNSTVMATEEGAKGVDAGVALASQARESIEKLGGAIDESTRVATQVVAGGQQVQNGVEQIAMAIQQINQVTLQSLASTRQTEKSAQNLNELARTLNQSMAQYDLAGSGIDLN